MRNIMGRLLVRHRVRRKFVPGQASLRLAYDLHGVWVRGRGSSKPGACNLVFYKRTWKIVLCLN